MTTVPSHFKITKSRPGINTLFYGNENKSDKPITSTLDLLPQLDNIINTACKEGKISKKIINKDMDVKVVTKNIKRGMRLE